MWIYIKIKNIEAPLEWIDRISQPLFTSREIWDIILNAVLISLEKFIAKKSPLRIWILKHIPKRDPIFHIYEIFEGVGRLIIGFKFFFKFISYEVERGALEEVMIFITTIKVIIK